VPSFDGIVKFRRRCQNKNRSAERKNLPGTRASELSSPVALARSTVRLTRSLNRAGIGGRPSIRRIWHQRHRRSARTLHNL